jgi:hypothetical protein
MYRRYVQELLEVGLWPTKALPLVEYRERVTKMTSIQTANAEPCTSPRYSWCGCEEGVEKSSILEAIERVINSVQGMCLDCVNKGEGVQCRVKHSAAKY